MRWSYVVQTTDGGVLVRGVGAVSARSSGGVGSVRRSLPNMATGHLLHEPAKLYPYHLLLITNYRLPPDVDRLNLERHLSDAEFEAILQVGRQDFYRLPQWRRNELKRRARLFWAFNTYDIVLAYALFVSTYIQIIYCDLCVGACWFILVRTK